MFYSWCPVTFIIFYFLLLTDQVSSVSDDEKGKPCNQSVEERGLVTKTPNIRDVIEQNEAYSIKDASVKHFNQSCLGYVTPWNIKGYEIAVKFARKFTHISPVWLQLKIDHKTAKPYITGLQDVDLDWMKRLRQSNPHVKIVPRVLLDHWNQYEIQHLLENSKIPSLVGNIFVNISRTYTFDGFVLEAWNAFAIHHYETVARMISKIYVHLKKNKLQLILIVPPPNKYG